MDLGSIRSYCLGKAGRVTEEFPFGDDVLVFKVHGKAFLLARLTVHPPEMNLKCDPERAVELRDRYEDVRPGYHMNKKHWNSVVLDGTIPRGEIHAMIDHSYEQVVRGLKRKLRDTLLNSSTMQKEKAT
ncbi:MAG: MmcQ/YjbR family DNA-binding protein [Bacteroidota bacterium]